MTGRRKSKKRVVAKKIIVRVLKDHKELSTDKLYDQLNKELPKEILPTVNVETGQLISSVISDYTFNRIIKELISEGKIKKCKKISDDLRKTFFVYVG